ncbi:MAG: exopolyphosphatase [Eubacterium sp.]|nr:exopolyphosphatase [Eubacterium sp.]
MIKRYAAIFIGSDKCEIIVGQRGKGTVNILDRANYPIDFGYQSFNQRRIDITSVYSLCRILNTYIEIARGYDVESVDILFTSTLREAKNRRYVLEQIKSSTGCEVRLLEQEEEIGMIYKYAMLKCAPLFTEDFLAEGILLASIANGHTSSAILKEGIIDFYQVQKLGYLRLREMFSFMEARAENSEGLMEAYFGVSLKETVAELKDRKIPHMIVVAREAEGMAKLCGLEDKKPYHKISRGAFDALYQEIRGLSPNQLARKYPFLDKNSAEIIKHSLIFYLKLLDDTKIEGLILVHLNVCDAMVQAKLGITREQGLKEWLDDCTLALVRRMGQRYGVDQAHSAAVEKLAGKIFDSLKKRFNLGRRERTLMTLAVWLMDMGRFVSQGRGDAINHVLVAHSDIIGLSEADKRIVGAILDGLRVEPFDETRLEKDLSAKQQIMAAKLIVILKLAVALDKSHQQKISRIQCRVEGTTFIVTARSTENIQLEAYFFDACLGSIAEVFGLQARLIIKREKI